MDGFQIRKRLKRAMGMQERQQKVAAEARRLLGIQGKPMPPKEFFTLPGPAKRLPLRKPKKTPKPVKTKINFKLWGTQMPWMEKPIQDTDSAFDSGRHFVHKLKKKGFKVLGSGAYSTVLGKDGSDKCIKVCRRIEQDGWLDFIKWSSDNGYAGTFAPKVTSYKWVNARTKEDGKQSGFGLAVMEKLDTTLRHLDYTDDHSMIEPLIERAVRGSTLASLLADEIAPGIGKFVTDFSERFKGRSFDLHGGNIMLRKGKVVLVDPLPGGEESFSKRVRLRARDFSLASVH